MLWAHPDCSFFTLYLLRWDQIKLCMQQKMEIQLNTLKVYKVDKLAQNTTAYWLGQVIDE